jgi:L-2-hydroxycarboxylate dehydrogenase (NAD+)
VAVEVRTADLHAFAADVLRASGVPQDHADIVADSIVDAHRRGKGTHGISRLPIYVRKIRQGLMAPDTPISFVRDNPVIAVLDAHHGFGQVAGVRAIEMCIERAQRYGVGIIGVRRSNNFGVAGYFAAIAARNQMVGIVLANSAPAIAPTGGSRPVFGTNPLAVAFPGHAPEDAIVLDMATSVAARGRIRLAAKNAEDIPFGWALDANGKPTNDPAAALAGSMLPIGDHKGYGLSLAIDVLAGLLTGAAFAGDVKPLNHPDEPSNNGHLFVAISIDHFMEIGDYLRDVGSLRSRVKASGNKDEVLFPGESAAIRFAASRDYVVVGDAVFSELTALAGQLGLRPPTARA